jgi:hypothetical protein
MMSYVELDEHPRKHSLMAKAWTLQKGINDGMEIIKQQAESKANL